MENAHQPSPASVAQPPVEIPDALLTEVRKCGPREAARLLGPEPAERIAQVLESLNPALAQDLLDEFSVQRRQAILAAAPAELSRQWLRNHAYPEGSVGRLMDPPIGVFSVGMTVGDTIEQLRHLVTRRFITYGYVIDAQSRLCGVLVMRDLLFADRSMAVEAVMVREPFALQPDLPLMDAMRLVAARQYPAYPVCDAAGHIIGVVRGQTLFEAEAFEISAQAGSMVGVDKEERLATPWSQSLRLRQPWLQLNLLTAFLAGAVVSAYQQTISQIVLLVVFVPVLSSQSANTGCQALAVTLRGITLGDLKRGGRRRLLAKEAALGLLNGALVGVSAALAMFALAAVQRNPLALPLAIIVFAAMTASCLISGISGALVPLILKRIGADPATASSILLTTATDVVSLLILLSLGARLLR
jgi:magnesium transporter